MSKALEAQVHFESKDEDAGHGAVALGEMSEEEKAAPDIVAEAVDQVLAA